MELGWILALPARPPSWTISVSVLLLAAGTLSGGADQDFRVSTVAELQARINAARPGDRIVVQNGVYRADRPIRVARSGSASHPIVIAAATVGGAEMKGNACFDFVGGASHIEIRGFVFHHGCGFRTGGGPAVREVWRYAGQLIPADSRGVRFVNNTFQISGGAKEWLVVRGDDALIDSNLFRHKSTEGAFLSVAGTDSDGIAQRTIIRRNHFLDHSYGEKNHGESVKIGDNTLTYSSGTVVEGNLFERANGDPEAISSKSGDVIIRFNTIRNSRGCIVLRSADRNQVYGNFITGSGCGIRVHGDDHRIFNNVIVDNRGPALWIWGGDVLDLQDPPNAGAARDSPRDVLIAFNTLVGNDEHIVGRAYGRYPPSSIRIANNIIVGDSGLLVNIPWGSGFGYDNNILWGAAEPGSIPLSGYRHVDPRLEQASGIYRLTSDSPAIDAATARHPEINSDYDGQPRTDPKDIGADERTSGRIRNQPRTANDVGPRRPSVSRTPRR